MVHAVHIIYLTGIFFLNKECGVSHMLPENRFSAKTEQVTILMGDFISLYESQMKNLDYFNESINRRIRMLKIPYLADKSILLEKQGYSMPVGYYRFLDCSHAVPSAIAAILRLLSY